MNIILSLTSVILGIAIASKYFNIYSAPVPLDIVFISAVFLIVLQVFEYFSIHMANKAVTFMGIVLFLFLEGLYGMY